MKRKVLVVFALACAWTGADLLACGNKFLVPSRGTRFGKVPVARQAVKILVYAPPDSVLARALGDVSVASILAEVGYRPTTASGPAELEAALRQGAWDLVLADLGDSTTLRDRLQGVDAPAILPVLHDPSRRELAEAKQTYGQVIRSPTKSQRLIETVDYAVATLVKHRAAGADQLGAG